MAKIHEAGGYLVPYISDFEISSKISFISTFTPSEKELELFRIGVLGVQNQITNEGINIDSLPRVTAVITDKKKLTIELDKDAGGSRFNLVFYPVNHWRENGWNDYIVLGAILEELCHHFWNIEDEAVVKRKVIDIMNSCIFNKESQITIDYVYNEEWIKEYEYRRDNGLDLSDLL